MASKVSIRQNVKDAKREETQAVKAAGSTKDSFQNFAAKMGVGTDNLTSYSTYGFNPITRIRILLEWIHRGSWIGGVAVDTVAEDMTRGGVSIKGELKPKDIARIEELAVQLNIWSEVRDDIAWSRLYGGAICVYLVEGQRLSTPLRVETVGPKQFKGLITLDRWMVEPSLNDLITDFGPDLGKPKYYTVNANAPALIGERIHYTRVLRMDGVHLPFNQRMMENLWGISIYERMYDRMIAFDSATTGAAQSVYKSYLRTVSMKDLRENIAAGGGQLDGVVQYVQMMARFQSIEGITILDLEDEFSEGGAQNFAGLREALMCFMEQLAGAIGVPLVRLFGMSPAGFSTGDTDLRMHYDTINKEQKSKLLVFVTNIYRMIAQSEGIDVPKGFGVEFNPLWQLTETEKSTIASSVSAFVSQAREQGVVKPDLALKELKQSSKVTGYWTNITDKDISDAEEEGPPTPSTVEGAEASKGDGAPGEKKPPTKPGGNGAGGSKDSASTVAELARLHDLHVVVESPAGSIRRGIGWESLMPDDYGYIRRRIGADGDAIDCFIGTEAHAPNAYIIDQRDLRTGLFDEHKLMLGYGTAGRAIETYLLAYDEGDGNPERIMAVTPLTIAELKYWLEHSSQQEPCAGSYVTLDSLGVRSVDCAACQSGDCISHDAAFKESDHPRKRTGAHAGEFTAEGSSEAASSLAAKHKSLGFAAPSLTKVPSNRKAWPSWFKTQFAGRVPPGATDVRIATNPKSAQWGDYKPEHSSNPDRRIPIYNPEWTKLRAQAKFGRVTGFIKDVPKIVATLDRDIKSSDEKTRALAACLSLVAETGMRAGREGNADKDGAETFGATTIQGKHVKIVGGEVHLKFPGKKGVAQDVVVNNTDVVKVLKARAAEHKGSENLFPELSYNTFYSYAKRITGGHKPHDLRTARGSDIALKQIAKVKAPTTPAEYRKAVLEVGEAVAKQLGNGRNEAIKSYICTQVWRKWNSARDKSWNFMNTVLGD